MSLQEEIVQILKKPDDGVIFLPILPPSDLIASYLSAFSNTDGGYIVLGVGNNAGKLDIHGISTDFNAIPITQKAMTLLSPLPMATFGYVTVSGKQLFVIKTAKSPVSICFDGKEYKIVNSKAVEINPDIFHLQQNAYLRVVDLSNVIIAGKKKTTRAAAGLLSHFLGLLRIIDNLQPILFPAGPTQVTIVPEGKITIRIILSSAVDNFEVYLGELLYEISLARPDTLKSSQTVTIEEVLKCTDIEEFVKFIARKKITKFQKGSVREFIKENPPIADLQILSPDTQNEIEKILQIRHLFTHRNGIVDEKYKLFTQSPLNVGMEYLPTADELLDKIAYLLDVVQKLDKAAIEKYLLA
jgi:hypothetical protein